MSGQMHVRVLEFVAPDKLVSAWGEVGGAVLVEINALAQQRGASHFVIKDEEERILLQGPVSKPFLDHCVARVCEYAADEFPQALKGELAEETLLPGITPFGFGLKQTCVQEKRTLFHTGQGSQGMVFRMWVRVLRGDKARAFIADGAGVARASVLRNAVTSVARKSATTYGCEAYGLFDASTGMLLAFEKAAKADITWAARYEKETGREVNRKLHQKKEVAQ